MPRPGPRPYECVRRAWHSDRHQPIRGSLIQEIFRVVNEIHSSATKKNKEWQEKIPIVVLKAEEIMYSKANSEAEYMDPKTLWGRANDAINTIIRRDESTETGKFLPPCIEAALILGCTPRRASRSQRNNNQRCYLNPHNQEPTSIPSSILDNTTPGIHTTNYTSHYPNLVKFPTMKLTHFGSEPLCLVSESNSFPNNKFPSSYYFPPSSNIQCLLKETCPASKSYSVYPLYYGNNLQFDESQFGFGIPPKPNCSVVKPNDMGIIQNRFPYDLDASKKTMQTEPGDTPENQPFDLSLRLAPLSVPCSTVNNSLSLEVEDVISSSARKGSKSSIPLPQKGKGFSFFHMGNTDVPLDSSLSKWSPQQATMGKRKANVSHPTEDMIFCSQPKRQSFHFTHFNGGRRNAD